MKKLFPLLALLICVPCFGQAKIGGNTQIGGNAQIGSTASAIPAVVQVSGATGGSGTNCNTYGTTLVCTFPANLGGSGASNLVALMESDGGGGTWSTPVGTGAGCPSTWTVIGTQTTNGAAFLSSATSAGACSVTLAGSTTNGLNGAIFEATGIIATPEGTPSYTTFTYCGSCTGPSITTTTNEDLVLTLLNTSNAITFTGSWVTDLSAVGTNSGTNIGAAHQVLNPAGTVSSTWTSAGGSGAVVLVAIKP